MPEINEEELTPLELEELQKLMGNFPTPAEKFGIFHFFNQVLKREDSIKVSNLDKQEIASVRGLRSIALFADIMGLDKVNTYIKDEAEVILGSALSKKGFLIEKAITQKKELSSGSKKKESRWFPKKEVEGQ